MSNVSEEVRRTLICHCVHLRMYKKVDFLRDVKKGACVKKEASGAKGCLCKRGVLLHPLCKRSLAYAAHTCAERCTLLFVCIIHCYSRRSAAGSARTKATRCHKRKCRCRSRSNILRQIRPKTLYLAPFLCF